MFCVYVPILDSSCHNIIVNSDDTRSIQFESNFTHTGCQNSLKMTAVMQAARNLKAIWKQFLLYFLLLFTNMFIYLILTIQGLHICKKQNNTLLRRNICMRKHEKTLHRNSNQLFSCLENWNTLEREFYNQERINFLKCECIGANWKENWTEITRVAPQ